MVNLEEFSLNFIKPYGLIIDGDDLTKNIINHMNKLKKFTFNMGASIPRNELVNVPSVEDIQNTFKNFQNNQIISYVDYFSTSNLFYCRIHSYSYPWTFYHNITNNFPGGLFQCVREISLRDKRPFEHDFFVRIAESFPFIEKLCLMNREPQQNNNRKWLNIKYPHLTELNLVEAYENYVEQFLNDTKTCLLKNIKAR